MIHLLQNESNINPDQIWIEIFLHFRKENIPFDNAKKVVEFNLCLLGTNAATERIFSLINNIWTSKNTQLKLNTIESILIVRGNFDSCQEFCNKIKDNEEV